MKWTLLMLMLGALVCVRSDTDEGGDKDNQPGKHAPAGKHAWSYNLHDGKTGPGKWNDLFAEKCGTEMKRQSPINIQTKSTVFSDVLSDITVHESPSDIDKRMFLYNNGHSVKLEMDNAEVYVMGGGLDELFKVAQLHFHWGSTDKQGSEHTFNNRKFPLEMHVVTYNSERYSNLGDAVKGHNSLAVFGTWYKLSKPDNPNLVPIVKRLQDVKKPGAEHKTQIDWFPIRNLMPPTTSKYFRYEGSLTTPTCDQSVVWTVFAVPSYVSSAQLEQFRSLVEGIGGDGQEVALQDNWRSPQPLHGRVVTRSFPGGPKYNKRSQNQVMSAASTSGATSLHSIVEAFTLLLGFLCARAVSKML